MPNPTDTTPESEGQNSWPRKILIQPTAAKAIEMLGDRYDSSRDPEGDDALMLQIGDEFTIYAEINSWDHFADKYAGYELLYPATVSEQRPTFKSLFFQIDAARPVRVPDYQRAYSWEQKQIQLFIADLEKYQGDGKGYYFGHFIAEDTGGHWEIVDGQQRITTFVLFLMVCQILSPLDDHASAYSMISQFFTVSYDQKALETLKRIPVELKAFLEANEHFDERKPPTDDQIKEALLLTETFTRSQKRMVLALLRFHQAFQKGEKKGGLEPNKIAKYIDVVMNAHCSLHLPLDKSVAVNIFEMHNTRGVPLTTLEIVKAMLMKFVYDHGGSKVEEIQQEFGEIYGMEEKLAIRSFRGEMTMEQILRLHLRVVDDGTKKIEKDFHSPPLNDDSDAIVSYVDSRLRFIFIDGKKTELERPKDEAVGYAINLAKEFKKSVQIISELLPAWDKDDSLVGDVLILDRDLSCQFFLIICRHLAFGDPTCERRLGRPTLLLWEKLLFTRDFHGKYYNLKGARDNFPAFFASCQEGEEQITNLINEYLVDGFRPDLTKGGLQSIVVSYLRDNKPSILNRAFYWHPWKAKMIYVIYKYEISNGANIREVMKGKISVEHILPQEWVWIKDEDGYLVAMSIDEWDSFYKEIENCINGIGNLLLITPGENTSLGNNHPKDKEYEKYCNGGSYKEHSQCREKWSLSKEWPHLINERGEKIFNFMLSTLVGASESLKSKSTD